ncbi:MAG: Phenylalanine--tRNA ligase alpha subunit [Chlamydiales bacterium]|nr:Phenylalanine--tRNA ligase alpha subunit [Chlamydiales bacterium]MCH9634972.1 Phenylalanine--tRNA ligase alpha subunit [Chlamydiales bacterium]MCH9704431.1 phenylalanine--tRNA ligase subunit alpha [Chlamydiota bacterium]
MNELLEQLKGELSSAASCSQVESLKVKYLGKKGLIPALMQNLRNIEPSERANYGKGVNELKQSAQALLDEFHDRFEKLELEERIASEKLDVTLPGRCQQVGRRHVILQLLDEVVEILTAMGFSSQTGPDIEKDYYNFEALNFQADHPARDMQDTFYVAGDILMRTHTSNVQVRVMENSTPPIRAIAFGKCYRNEDISARSHVLFHQVEGFYIDRHVTFADLFATLEEFFSRLFKKDVQMRYRPSYFPFVEPGLEVDVHCFLCDGKGCNVCKKTGFLEVAGAGLVHPEVLKSGGLDPEEYSGYAWALGIERLAMLRYGIPDIRLFMENNRRFLEQF